MIPRFHYDPEADAAHLRFSSAPIAQTDEVTPGSIFDFDESGRIVAVEFLCAGKRVPADALR